MTLLAINEIYGKDISAHSAYPEEQEVILLPGTRIRVESKPLNFSSPLSIIHLKEDPTFG
ncbi:unnamed protein product, partial [Rotaria sp. Silwood2]